MGAGIQFVAFRKGRAYLLYGRERIGTRNRDSGLWSDFGGGHEECDKNTYDTAVREAVEETMGMLGDEARLRSLPIIGEIVRNFYTCWILKIDFDDTLPGRFARSLAACEESTPELIEARNGLYEKDKVLWIREDRISRSKIQFRPWFVRSGIMGECRKKIRAADKIEV